MTSEKDPKEQPKAVVIGAGIAGVCTAWELSKIGFDVTVIERFSRAAQFCSMGNAGVARDHRLEPLQNWKSLTSEYKPKWKVLELLKSLSPLFSPNHGTQMLIDPYFFTDITSYKWLIAYVKSIINKKPKNIQKTIDYYEHFCANAYIENCKELEKMSKKSFSNQRGYANVFPPKKKVPKNPKNLYSDFSLSQLLKFDLSKAPLLSQMKDLEIELMPGAFVGDSHTFSNTVANQLQKKNEIKFLFNCEAEKIIVDKESNVCGVQIDKNTVLKAEKVVICAGILTNSIIQTRVYGMDGAHHKLSFIPIVPLQGYSLSVPYSADHSFGATVYYPSSVYASQINDSLLRFTNYGYFRSLKYAQNYYWQKMENVMDSKQGTQTNVDNIKQSKMESKLMQNLEQNIKDNLLIIYGIEDAYFEKHKVRWTGFRPFTPDSFPIVDEIENVNGLYVNAGHGLLGWAMSHGTAKLLANKIGKKTNTEQQNVLDDVLSMRRFS